MPRISLVGKGGHAASAGGARRRLGTGWRATTRAGHPHRHTLPMARCDDVVVWWPGPLTGYPCRSPALTDVPQQGSGVLPKHAARPGENPQPTWCRSGGACTRRRRQRVGQPTAAGTGPAATARWAARSRISRREPGSLPRGRIRCAAPRPGPGTRRARVPRDPPLSLRPPCDTLLCIQVLDGPGSPCSVLLSTLRSKSVSPGWRWALRGWPC
jgi:hypothetical protein